MPQPQSDPKFKLLVKLCHDVDATARTDKKNVIVLPIPNVSLEERIFDVTRRMHRKTIGTFTSLQTDNNFVHVGDDDDPTLKTVLEVDPRAIDYSASPPIVTVTVFFTYPPVHALTCAETPPAAPAGAYAPGTEMDNGYGETFVVMVDPDVSHQRILDRYVWARKSVYDAELARMIRVRNAAFAQGYWP